MKAGVYTKETIRELGMRELNFPDFRVGDTIGVMQRIKEGDKERLQLFEGDVIAMHNNGASSSFIVRKIGAHAISVERIFPLYTPLIDSIKIIKRGDVRRAKLFFVRNRVGKSARIKEKIAVRETGMKATQEPKKEE